MRILKPSLQRLLALILVPLLGGCLEFETQTIDFSYDAATDRATLHLVYHGLHWDDDNQTRGTKALKRAVEGGEFCLIDWPLHLVPDQLRNDDKHPAARMLGTQLKTTRVGFFKNADGQLSGGQIVTLDRVSDLIKFANAEISQWLIDAQGRPDDLPWDRHTAAMLLKAANSGHAWLRMNGNAVELHAFATDHDLEFFKRRGLRGLLKTKEKDRAVAIAWLSRLPVSWQRSGTTIVATLGNPQGRTRFVVPREGRKRYKPNLAEFAQKTWGYTLDGVVAQKLMKPDDTPLGRFARSLSLRERVRILLTQDGDVAAARLEAALDELPHPPELDEEGGVKGFWQEWLKGRKFKAEKDGNFEAAKVRDMNSVRNIVGLLVIRRELPMKDGQVDIFALVRNGEMEEQHFGIFLSARFGYGPTREQIKAGDYSKFPYGRFRGDGKRVLTARLTPLIWDRKPDSKGGRVMGFNSGAVKWVPEERALAQLRAAGQLPEKR